MKLSIWLLFPAILLAFLNVGELAAAIVAISSVSARIVHNPSLSQQAIFGTFPPQNNPRRDRSTINYHHMNMKFTNPKPSTFISYPKGGNKRKMAIQAIANNKNNGQPWWKPDIYGLVEKSGLYPFARRSLSDTLYYPPINPSEKKVQQQQESQKIEEKRKELEQIYSKEIRKEKEYEYDEKLAKKLSSLSRGAYSRETRWKTYADIMPKYIKFPMEEGWRFGGVVESKCESTGFNEAFLWTVSDEKKELILTFRGTMSNRQLLKELLTTFDEKADYDDDDTNFWPIKVQGERRKVNKYFFAVYQHLWKDIERLLTDKKYEGYSVIFHGHSLGGAVSSLAAIRAVDSGLLSSENVRHYTQGEPRIGNYAFAQHFDSHVPHSFRVVHGQDPIPHWPLFDPRPNGSYHHSTEVWYEDKIDGKYKICLGEPPNEDRECSNQFEFVNAAAMARFFKHHEC